MLDERICTLLVGKHASLMGYLAARLEYEAHLGVQEVVTTIEAAIEFLRQRPVHAVVIDWDSEDRDIVQDARAIKSAAPKARIILIAAAFDDLRVEAALRSGVAGLILKRDVAASLTTAVREVTAGGTVLPEEIRSRIIVENSGPRLEPPPSSSLGSYV